MFLPLRTDALVPYRPYGTSGVIAANVLAHVWAQSAGDAAIAPFVLQYGRWAPWQWLTSAFLHADWFHLLGNMVFLWAFGLVVEGLVGWVRFLAVYGTVALLSGGVEQTLLLGASGGSLGASGVIFGLMAIAFLWAPENEIECAFVWFPVVRRFDVPISTFVGFYVAWELLLTVVAGFSVSSALLHLLGAVAGLWIGVLMLRRGWVNCLGWDWFSRRRKRALPDRVAKPREPTASARPPARAEALRPASVRFTLAMTARDADAALRVHAGCGDAERSSLPLALRERLIGALDGAARAADARPVAEGVLRDDPGNPVAGLLAARLLLEERRHSAADAILAASAGRLTSDDQRRTHADLAARVAALRASGAIELDD